MTATGYSTTVGGKQYSGSVSESDGQYTASIPSLPGATATGSSLDAAENALNSRIDELV
jgi:predicted RNase H-like HicB family nuclease